MLPGRAERAARAHRLRVRDRDPARAAARSATREEELVLEALRSGRLSLGPAAARRSRSAFAARLGVEHVSAVSSGTAGLHLAIRAAGIEPGDEVVTTPFSFVASANCLLYEGATPVFCDIDPRTLNIDPAAAGGGGRPSAPPGCCRCTSSATRPTCRRSSGSPRERGLWIVEDACEALGAVHADGTAGRRARQPRRVRLLPEQADHDGRGRRGRVAVGRGRRSGSTPSATRAARPTWAGSTTTGSASTTGSTTCRARSGWRSSSGSTSCSPAARGWPALYSRGAGGRRGARACPAPTRAATGAAGSSTWCSCRTAWTATPRSSAMRERGVDTKPYLPAIHLMSFYRERFGHREGEFPVCEDVAPARWRCPSSRS